HWQGLKIEDTPRPLGRDDLFTMQRTLRFSPAAPITSIWFRAALADKIDPIDDQRFKIDDRWSLRVIPPQKMLLRPQGNQTELLVTVQLENGPTQIELIYDW